MDLERSSSKATRATAVLPTNRVSTDNGRIPNYYVRDTVKAGKEQSKAKLREVRYSVKPTDTTTRPEVDHNRNPKSDRPEGITKTLNSREDALRFYGVAGYLVEEPQRKPRAGVYVHDANRTTSLMYARNAANSEAPQWARSGSGRKQRTPTADDAQTGDIYDKLGSEPSELGRFVPLGVLMIALALSIPL